MANVFKTDLEMFWQDELLEQQGYKDYTDFYTKLLTQGAQAAQESAAAFYNPVAQQAASQASYDISGAYANYLKQQKNIMSQSGLESGYKEEVGSELQSAYSGAYQQAKATEAQSLTSAAQKASDIYTSGIESTQKTISSKWEAMANEASQRAKLFKATEEYAAKDLTGDLYKPYATYDESGARIGEGIYQFNSETGEYEITDLGKDLYTKTILGDADAYKAYLEEEGLLDYYLANQEMLTKDLFGVESFITDTETGKKTLASYDATSEASMKARYSTPGYVTSLIKQNPIGLYDVFEPLSVRKGFGNSDIRNVEKNAPKVKNYYNTVLGLTDKDVHDLLGTDIVTYFSKEAKRLGKKYGINDNLDFEEFFNNTITKLQNAAKKKYGV